MRRDSLRDKIHYVVCGCYAFQHNKSLRHFPRFIVAARNHRTIRHRRMRQQHRLQFGRRHLKSFVLNQFFHAINDEEVSIFIRVTDVTSVQPTISVDGDGWLHTGDIGYADEDGHFFIVDRVKELIKYKGFQVAPAELEAVLLTHPAVADCAVIPCRDDEAGEVPKAFVVLKGEATADDIMNFVTERVAPHKKIRALEFIEQIPKSLSVKILRRVLVEKERAKAAKS